MKKNSAMPLSLTIITLLIVQQTFMLQAPAQTGNGATDKDEEITRLARLSGEITIRASGRSTSWLTLTDGRKLVTSYIGPQQARRALEQNQARPLSLAWHGSDHSGEGYLVCGYASPSGGGIMALHRSSSDATAHASNAAPFEDYARVFELPEPAEFLATGDFNADGRKDMAVASSTGESLYLMRGSAYGGLGLPTRIELPGRVTAMVAGEINRADGLADLAIAVACKEGPQLLIYEGPEGAFSREPEILALPRRATSMAIGLLDSSHEYDLAIAAGNELLIVHGRDRKLSLDSETQAQVERAAITREYFPFTLAAIAAGEFIREGNRTDLAVVSENGRVQYLRRGDESGRGEWRVATEVSLGEAARTISSPSPLSMVKADLSALETDDLMLIGGAGNQMHIVSGGPGTKAGRLAPTPLKTEGRVVAAMPFRSSGLHPGGWAVLTSSRSAPSLALVPTATTITVTTNADSGPGSLRDAINQANGTPGSDGVNITFQSDMTITLQSALPILTREKVTINSPSGKMVTLEGNREWIGLHVTGGGALINRLDFSGFSIGIRLEGGGRNAIINSSSSAGRIGVEIFSSDNNRIGLADITNVQSRFTNNEFAGVRISGTSMGNTVVNSVMQLNGAGVLIDGNASNNTIGGFGSVFGLPLGAGNSILQNGTGILIAGNATGNIVQGNLIADASREGITVTERAARNTIGGVVAQSLADGKVPAANVIVGNASHGVVINGKDAEGQKIQGNLIGIFPDGNVTTPLSKEANGGDGIRVEEAPNTEVGGASRGAGNTTSKNAGNGIGVNGVRNGTTKVQGNKSGTDPSGRTTDPDKTPNSGDETGNKGEGIRVENSSDVSIGGTSPGVGNIVGGNSDGLSVINSNNVVAQGNSFGTNLLGDNLANMGAGAGVAGNSFNILFGGTGPGAPNLFGYNGVHLFITPGVSLISAFNQFRGHHMENLAGPPTGVKAEVNSAVSSDTATAIQGMVTGGLPNQDFTVQVYWRPKDDFVCKALGGFALRANQSGSAGFTANFSSPLATGSSISILVSEQHRPLVFSDHVEVTGETPKKAVLELTKTGPETARCGQEITYTITVANKGDAAAIDPVVLDMITPPECIEDISFTPSQGLYTPFIFNPTSLGRINPSGSATITVKVKIKDDCAGTIMQAAAVFGDDKDGPFEDPPDSSADVSTKVECTRITGISMQGKHVVVTGTGFQKGDKVEINGSPVKKTRFKGDDQLLAKKGGSLLNICDPSNRERMNSVVVRRNGESVASFDSPICPPGAESSTTITSSQNPAPFGQPVTFTATVTPSNGGAATPTGIVEFKDGDTVIGSGSLNNSGQASFTTSNLTAGTHNITAAYRGDINFDPSTSSALTQVVNAAANATTTDLTSNPNPSLVGLPVAFIATVTAVSSGSGTPTGFVRFMNGTTELARRPLNADGRAGMTVPNLTAGTHRITAVYEGDSDFTGSTSNVVNQVVNPATQ